MTKTLGDALKESPDSKESGNKVCLIFYNIISNSFGWETGTTKARPSFMEPGDGVNSLNATTHPYSIV